MWLRAMQRVVFLLLLVPHGADGMAREAGFTLFECLCAMAIGVALLLGGVSYLSLYPQYQLRQTARALVQRLQTARMMAVRLQTDVVVCAIGPAAKCKATWQGRLAIKQASKVAANTFAIPTHVRIRFRASFAKNTAVQFNRWGFSAQQGRFYLTNIRHPAWQWQVQLQPWGARVV